MACLHKVAQGLPQLRPGAKPDVLVTGGGTYVMTLPLVSASFAADARCQFLTRLWYAARRESLALDGNKAQPVDDDQIREAVREMTPALSLSEEEIADIARRADIEEFSRGEPILREGDFPTHLMYVLEGQVRLMTRTRTGEPVFVADLDRGEVLAEAVTLREPARTDCLANSLVHVLRIPADVVNDIVRSRPIAGRRLGTVVTIRRQQVRDALAARDDLGVGSITHLGASVTA